MFARATVLNEDLCKYIFASQLGNHLQVLVKLKICHLLLLFKFSTHFDHSTLAGL